MKHRNVWKVLEILYGCRHCIYEQKWHPILLFGFGLAYWFNNICLTTSWSQMSFQFLFFKLSLSACRSSLRQCLSLDKNSTLMFKFISAKYHLWPISMYKDEVAFRLKPFLKQSDRSSWFWLLWGELRFFLSIPVSMTEKISLSFVHHLFSQAFGGKETEDERKEKFIGQKCQLWLQGR